MTLLSACCWVSCWPWMLAAAWLGASVTCLAISLVHYSQGARAAAEHAAEHAAELEATRVAHRGELEQVRREAAGEYPWGRRPPEP